MVEPNLSNDYSYRYSVYVRMLSLLQKLKYNDSNPISNNLVPKEICSELRNILGI